MLAYRIWVTYTIFFSEAINRGNRLAANERTFHLQDSPKPSYGISLRMLHPHCLSSHCDAFKNFLSKYSRDLVSSLVNRLAGDCLLLVRWPTDEDYRAMSATST